MAKYILYFLITIQALAVSLDLPDYIRAETKFIPENTMEEGYRHKLHTIQEYGEVEKRKYDALRYDYELDLTQALSSELDDDTSVKKYFSGSNNITIRLLENTNEIEFDAAMSTITDVSIAGESLGFTHSKEENLLTVMLNNVSLGDELAIKIEFEGTGDDFENYRNNRGMHIYHKGEFFNQDISDVNMYTEHNIAYSMSEPELARYWMPCNDRPYDKAISSMSITVPNGYKVASNGRLTDVYVLDDTKTLFVWDNEDPIATYLMNFAASVYSEYHQEAITESDTIPMVHYFWEEDRDGEILKLEASMDTHPKMMQILTDNYGPYPFVKYGTATVYPFPYGGMEHQTMVTQHRFWIQDLGDAGFVHEMGHHWFGDLITCATWADIWFQEGGATLTEAIYFGDLYGYNNYVSAMRNKINYYFRKNSNNSSGPIYAVPINKFFGDDSYLIYDKAAIVFHLLKQNVGDDQFFAILQQIFEEWKYKSITTAEFEQEWIDRVENPIVDIETFFEQWVYGAGHPEYEMDAELLNIENDEYQFRIDLTQVQRYHSQNSQVSDLFITPIRIITTNENRTDTTEILLNDKIEQSFNLTLDYIPTDIYLDELTTLHQLNETTATSAETDNQLTEIELYPNPISSGNANLFVPLKNTMNNLSIKLIDTQGRTLQNIFDGINDGKSINYKINADKLTTGIYFVVINLNGKRKMRKLIVN